MGGRILVFMTFLITISVAAACSPAGGQAITLGRESTLAISPIWRVGESHALEIAKEEHDVLNGVETLILTGRTPVEVTILEQLDDGGYVLQWSYGRVELEGTSVENDPFNRAELSLLDGARVEFEMDDAGRVLSIRNWPELQAAMSAAIERMATSQEASGIDFEEVRKISDILEERIDEQDFVEMSAMNDLDQFYGVYGWSPFNTEEPESHQVLAPDPINGELIPSSMALEPVAYEAGQEQIVVESIQTYDEETVNQSVYQMIADQAAAMGWSKPSEDDLGETVVVDSITCALDARAGWPVSVTWLREIQLGLLTLTERNTYTAIE